MNDSGSTAIVTGGGKRVGEAIVRALLDDGWNVIAHVHHDADTVADGAVKAVADLEKRDCADRIFESANGFPPVRLLVNNAARFVFDEFGQASAELFDAHMAVNARAPMLLIDEMARRHQGGNALVVNLLDAKLPAPNPDFLSYTLSKYALGGLTELAARALAATSRGVAEIAVDVGYESESAFNRAFKREFGLPPARYRREHRAANESPPA